MVDDSLIDDDSSKEILFLDDVTRCKFVHFFLGFFSIFDFRFLAASALTVRGNSGKYAGKGDFDLAQTTHTD